MSHRVSVEMSDLTATCAWKSSRRAAGWPFVIGACITELGGSGGRKGGGLSVRLCSFCWADAPLGGDAGLEVLEVLWVEEGRVMIGL